MNHDTPTRPDEEAPADGPVFDELVCRQLRVVDKYGRDRIIARSADNGHAAEVQILCSERAPGVDETRLVLYALDSEELGDAQREIAGIDLVSGGNTVASFNIVTTTGEPPRVNLRVAGVELL